MIDLQREEDIPQAPAHVLVQVTNRNIFTLSDRFDGVPVKFPPNETVTISRVEAEHFFGYPGEKADMAIHMAKRFGWNTAKHVEVDPIDGPDGLRLFEKYAGKIDFVEQEFELVAKNTKADDGLDVEDLPKGNAPPSPAEQVRASRVGRGRHVTPSARTRAGRRPKKVADV